MPVIDDSVVIACPAGEVFDFLGMREPAALGSVDV